MLDKKTHTPKTIRKPKKVTIFGDANFESVCIKNYGQLVLMIMFNVEVNYLFDDKTKRLFTTFTTFQLYDRCDTKNTCYSHLTRMLLIVSSVVNH